MGPVTGALGQFPGIKFPSRTTPPVDAAAAPGNWGGGGSTYCPAIKVDLMRRVPGARRKLRPALAEVCIGPGSVGSWPESCEQPVVKLEPGSWLLDPHAQHQ